MPAKIQNSIKREIPKSKISFQPVRVNITGIVSKNNGAQKAISNAPKFFQLKIKLFHVFMFMGFMSGIQ